MSAENPADQLAQLAAKFAADSKASGWSKEPLPPKPQPPPIVRAERDPERDRENLGAIIVNLYLLKKRDHTTIEISVHTTFSLPEIERILKERLPKGIAKAKRKQGKKSVVVYGPSREHLRELLIKAETRKPERYHDGAP